MIQAALLLPEVLQHPLPHVELPAGARTFSERKACYHLIQGDTLEVLAGVERCSVDVIFADPPYFLSGGGSTCSGGERVSVDKGEWDAARSAEQVHAFNTRWLRLCQRVLRPHGTIWVSGTSHVIHSVGYAMQQLGYKLLNDITWEKPNPPPNLGCRCFTHSTETLVWAARDGSSSHVFNYAAMRELNRGKQMKSVWRIQAPREAEKAHGRHPTQKPVDLLERVLAASTRPDACVLDPFMGSGTTGVAARSRGLRFIGIEREYEYIKLATARIEGAMK